MSYGKHEGALIEKLSSLLIEIFKNKSMQNPFLKKIIYRSRYRGSLELDLLFKKFFEIHGQHLSPEDLQSLSLLLEKDDLMILKWIRQETPLSKEINPLTFEKLQKCFYSLSQNHK